MKTAKRPSNQLDTASPRERKKERKREKKRTPNARKGGVEVNDVNAARARARAHSLSRSLARTTYILLFNFSRQGVMRHEKSLGRYCRWISRREHAPPGLLFSRPARHRRAAPGAALAVTLLFVMNGFTRPQIIAMFIFRTAALLVIQFNGGGI